MNYSSSVSGRTQRQWRKEERWLEWLCVGGLGISALFLFCSGLNQGPLLDGQEATLAQVAKEIIQVPVSPSGMLQDFSDTLRVNNTIPVVTENFAINEPWLFPTLWGQPYFDHSFLVPSLMAIAYQWFGIHEWTTRLPIALLAALSVPLFYKASKELFVNRLTAFVAGFVYLTLLLVVYWGRLGTVNGAILFFVVLFMDGILRSRRNLRASLEVGLALTGLLLTEPLLAILLSVTVIGFWAWDTPRLLQSPSIAFGVLLGLVPAISWYSYQWQHYGSVFWQEILSPQEFTSQGQWFKLVLFYGLKLSLYSLPWLIFAIYGWQITWKSQYWSWARFILSWGGGYTLLLLMMPGYWEAALIPLFPLLALTSAIALIQLRNFPLIVPYPKPLRLALLGFALISILITAAIAFNWPIHWLSDHKQPFALLVLFFLSFTLVMAANLMDRHRTEFISILMWGIYVSLVLLVNTPFGLAEFSGKYPVKPVASLIQRAVPPNQLVYTSFPKERSSLNFYSNHPVIPAEKKELLKYWQENKSPYLLVDGETLTSLEKSSVKLLGESVPDWHLITKK